MENNIITITYNKEVKHNGKLLYNKEVTKNKLDIFIEQYHNPRADDKVGYIIPFHYNDYLLDNLDKDDTSSKIVRLEKCYFDELEDKYGSCHNVRLNTFINGFKLFLKRNNINVRKILPLYYYDFKYSGYDEFCLLEKKYDKEHIKDIYLYEDNNVFGYYVIPNDFKGNYKKIINYELSLLTKFYNLEIYYYQLYDNNGLLEDSGIVYDLYDLKNKLPAEFKDQYLSDYIRELEY